MRHVDIPVARHDVPATHGAGCTHSAALAASLAVGVPLVDAVRRAAAVAGEAVRHALVELGAGEDPVHALFAAGDGLAGQRPAHGPAAPDRPRSSVAR